MPLEALAHKEFLLSNVRTPRELGYKYEWKILTFRVALTKDGKYAIRVLTRSTSHARSSELASLPNVSFYVGDPYNEDDLHEAFKGVDYAFVNLNGFAIGEKAEVFWGMRIFEIARSMGCKWFVWGNLDYGLKKGAYDEKYRCGHYDGKGRVAGM